MRVRTVLFFAAALVVVALAVLPSAALAEENEMIPNYFGNRRGIVNPSYIDEEKRFFERMARRARLGRVEDGEREADRLADAFLNQVRRDFDMADSLGLPPKREESPAPKSQASSSSESGASVNHKLDILLNRVTELRSKQNGLVGMTPEGRAELELHLRALLYRLELFRGATPTAAGPAPEAKSNKPEAIPESGPIEQQKQTQQQQKTQQQQQTQQTQQTQQQQTQQTQQQQSQESIPEIGAGTQQQQQQTQQPPVKPPTPPVKPPTPPVQPPTPPVKPPTPPVKPPTPQVPLPPVVTPATPLVPVPPGASCEVQHAHKCAARKQECIVKCAEAVPNCHVHKCAHYHEACERRSPCNLVEADAVHRLHPLAPRMDPLNRRSCLKCKSSFEECRKTCKGRRACRACGHVRKACRLSECAWQVVPTTGYGTVTPPQCAAKDSCGNVLATIVPAGQIAARIAGPSVIATNPATPLVQPPPPPPPPPAANATAPTPSK